MLWLLPLWCHWYLSLDTWLNIMLTYISPHSIEPQCCFYLSYCSSERLFSVVLYCRQTTLICLLILFALHFLMQFNNNNNNNNSRAWAENLGDIWQRPWNLLSVPANFRFDTAFQRYPAARELCWWEPLGWLTIGAIISSVNFCLPPRELIPRFKKNNNNYNTYHGKWMMF